MDETEKPRDPVERIKRGLTGNFGKGSAALKLRYEGQEREVREWEYSIGYRER